MQKLIELGSDMASLWGEYWKSYLNGIANTLILALVATRHRLSHRICMRYPADHSPLQE